MFRHKHEMESGRTSSVGNDILGFDASGNVVNKPDHGNLDWIKICEKSSKVITFIDLAGHEKYLKTTVFGMTGHAPDFAMLMIGANAGVIGMTKEHLGLALALNVPVFVVVTKIDMCPPNVLQETLKMLQRILKSPGCRKIPVLYKTLMMLCAQPLISHPERMCPIFQVSNVSGENLDLLKMFLNLLSTRLKSETTAPAEFQIDDTFSVPGVGTVVSGTLLQGTIKLNDTLLLGPDALGHFQQITVKSIHRKRMPVREVKGGQTASFSLKKVKRSSIRKGMVMVSPKLEPKACWEFEGEILVLHHPTTISVRYQAMVHVGSVRQTATIMNMTKEHLRTGDKSIVRFRFIKNPEYLKTDMRMVFREGRTKAIGNITKLYPHVSAVAQNTRQQRAAKKAQEANHQVHPQNEPQKPSKKRRTRNSSKNLDMEESKENLPSTSSMQEVTVQS
uniref:Tr-type G domain-containing protein n=1 Tax=Magallana gigas TaxID=29159 RepID=A0A8W8LX31_MAGGI